MLESELGTSVARWRHEKARRALGVIGMQPRSPFARRAGNLTVGISKLPLPLWRVIRRALQQVPIPQTNVAGLHRHSKPLFDTAEILQRCFEPGLRFVQLAVRVREAAAQLHL